MKIKLLKGANAFSGIPVSRRSDGETGLFRVARPEGGVHCLVSGTTGSGKAIKIDTPVPTPCGWTTMGDLQVGDLVFGADGRPCTVTGAFDVMHNRPCYEVEFSDGSVITADADHLWATENAKARRSREHARDLDHTRVRRRVVPVDRYPQLRDLVLDYPVGVTIPQVAAATGLPPTSPFLHRIARCTPPIGRVRDTKIPMQYGTRTVIKAGPWTTLYPTDVYVGAVVKHGSRPLNDQRSKRFASAVRTTAQIAATVRDGHGHTNHSVATAGALECPPKELPVDPYTLGVFLGDGCTTDGQLTLNRDDAPDIVARIEEAGWVTREVPSADRPGCIGVRVLGLARSLRDVGVLGDKHIPTAYMRSSIDQRRALLSGLIDTDGTVAPRGATQFDSTLYWVATAVRELAVSLGYRATITSKTAWLNGVDYGDTWRVSWTTTDCLFTATRKGNTLRARTVRSSEARTGFRYITDVRPVPSVPVRCIRVDSLDHLYLVGESMIPTHNTYGENPVLLTCGALQVDQILIDTVKGIQSYQDIAGCLQMYEIDPGRAKRILKQLLNHTLPARTNHLAKEGLKQWAPSSSLRFLRVHIEEAWTLAEAREIVGLAVALRSAGGQLTYSIQQPTWEHIPTTVRNQMGSYRAYGITDSDYDQYALPEEVVNAGAKPSQWGADDPGMHYLVGPGMTAREKLMTHRSWSDGVGDHTFASAAAWVAENLRAMCPVTATSLGDLWTTHIAPLDLVKQVGLIVPGPVTGPALVTAAQAVEDPPVDDANGDDDFDGDDAEYLAALEELYDEDPELEESELELIGDRIIVTVGGEEDFELDATDLEEDDDVIPDDDEPTHPTVARMIGDPPKDGLTPEEFRQVLDEVVTEFLTSGADRLEAYSFLNILADSGWSRASLYKYMGRDPRVEKSDRGWIPVRNEAAA